MSTVKRSKWLKIVKVKTVQFEEFISFSQTFFKFVTFEFPEISKAKNHREHIKILLSDIFFWFSSINVCLFVSLSAVSALSKSFDMKALTFSMPLLTSTSLVVVKCLTVYCNKGNISDILKHLKGVFPKEKAKQIKYNIRSYFQSYKLFARIYAFLFMVPCVCVMAIPLITLASSGRKTFPLNTWIPFSSERDEVYAVAYLWTIWSCANSVIILIAIDTLMFVLITLISMEFHVLRVDFMDLKNVEGTKVMKETGKLIQRHNDLIEYSGKLENIFSPSFLYNFVQSSFVICLTAFQYTTSSEASQFLFNGSYCAAILNQIWLLCYFGQKVVDASEQISSGAYNCGWENINSVKVRKALIMVIERAQSTTRLTAMNFTEISLKSFTTVSSM